MVDLSNGPWDEIYDTANEFTLQYVHNVFEDHEQSVGVFKHVSVICASEMHN